MLICCTVQLCGHVTDWWNYLQLRTDAQNPINKATISIGGGELWGVIPSVVVRLALINQCKCSESFILLFLFIHKLSGLRLTITNICQYWGTWMAPDYFTIAFWGKQCFWGNSAEFDFLQTLTSITWKYPNSSSQGPFSILDKTSNWRQLCWWKFEKIIQHFQNTHCHIAKFELHSKTK